MVSQSMRSGLFVEFFTMQYMSYLDEWNSDAFIFINEGSRRLCRVASCRAKNEGLPLGVMFRGMTCRTKGDQIVDRVITQTAARHLVMDLQIVH
jgi:hypothetical protein